MGPSANINAIDADVDIQIVDKVNIEIDEITGRPVKRSKNIFMQSSIDLRINIHQIK